MTTTRQSVFVGQHFRGDTDAEHVRDDLKSFGSDFSNSRGLRSGIVLTK